MRFFKIFRFLLFLIFSSFAFQLAVAPLVYSRECSGLFLSFNFLGHSRFEDQLTRLIHTSKGETLKPLSDRIAQRDPEAIKKVRKLTEKWKETGSYDHYRVDEFLQQLYILAHPELYRFWLKLSPSRSQYLQRLVGERIHRELNRKGVEAVLDSLGVEKKERSRFLNGAWWRQQYRLSLGVLSVAEVGFSLAALKAPMAFFFELRSTEYKKIPTDLLDRAVKNGIDSVALDLQNHFKRTATFDWFWKMGFTRVYNLFTVGMIVTMLHSYYPPLKFIWGIYRTQESAIAEWQDQNFNPIQIRQELEESWARSYQLSHDGKLPSDQSRKEYVDYLNSKPDLYYYQLRESKKEAIAHAWIEQWIRDETEKTGIAPSDRAIQDKWQELREVHWIDEGFFKRFLVYDQESNQIRVQVAN